MMLTAFRRLVLVIAALLVGVTVWCAVQAASWADRPFNGFFVQPMLYVSPYQHPDWAIGRHGLAPIDMVLAVEGRPVRDTADLVAAARAVPVGTPLTYQVLRGGERLDLRVPTRMLTRQEVARIFGFQATLGWSFLAISVALLWLRPELAAARAMSYLALVFGLIYLGYFDFQTTATLQALWVVVYPLMGIGFMGLALRFPREHRALSRWPWLPRALWAVGGLLSVLMLLSARPEGLAFSHPLRHALGMNLIFFSNLLAAAGLVWTLAAIFRVMIVEPVGSLARRQSSIALLGGMVGLVPGLCWIAPMAFGLNSPMPLSVALHFLILFPISIAFAILRVRLFDISFALRTSLVYLTLSTLLVVVYLGAAAGLRSLLPAREWFENLAATILVVALFVPLRDRVQALIDRSFFRESYDAQQALEAASRSMTGLLDRAEIVARLESSIARTLAPAQLDIFLAQDGTFVSTEGERVGTVSLVVAELVEAGEPIAGSEAAAGRRHRVSPYVEANAVLVPLMTGTRLRGFMRLGPRRSELPYNDRDLAMLQTLANQTAIALDNAEAYAKLQTFNAELEARVAERTAALEAAQARLVQTEKMSALGQLVAGVAHELNNPITFVVGGVEVLEERLADMRRLCEALEAGATPEEMAALRAELDADGLHEEVDTLLASCKEGAERTRAIVRGLRDFSRLDGFSKEPVALGPCLESTVPMVASSFRDRVSIRVESAEVPAVMGSAIHLKQVIMNLLVNACQAIEDRGTVHVSLAPHAEGAVLAVRDDGCGMTPEVQARLFDPFFTTKAPGEGTGLGLAICHGLVSAHGGRLEVESMPGEGSEFRVILPAAPVSEAACVRS